MTDTAPTPREFIDASFERIQSASGMGPGFMATAIRVELQTMWEQGAARVIALDGQRLGVAIRRAHEGIDAAHRRYHCDNACTYAMHEQYDRLARLSGDKESGR